MTSPPSGNPGRYATHREDGSAPCTARIRTGRAEIFSDDSVQVDGFALPHGSSLRRVLGEHGWRPTGGRAAAGGWGAIAVEPIRRG
jgi:hypothetical protein